MLVAILPKKSLLPFLMMIEIGAQCVANYSLVPWRSSSGLYIKGGLEQLVGRVNHYQTEKNTYIYQRGGGHNHWLVPLGPLNHYQLFYTQNRQLTLYSTDSIILT